jgi:hypothetical protein
MVQKRAIAALGALAQAMEQRGTGLCFQVFWLSGGWPIPTLAAALVKCCSSVTARKYRMWRRSMVIFKPNHIRNPFLRRIAA